MHSNIGIVILAAGNSTRLGKPKQLLHYQNTTLVNHAVNTAISTGCDYVLVITGAANNEVAATVENDSVTIIHNKDWESGMASSVRKGIVHLQNITGIQGALIILCDQPLITSDHLQQLIAAFAHQPDKMIFTAYADITGVPAIFPRRFFDALIQLTGDQGARQLISTHQQDVITVPFESAALDIDTEEDYKRLL